MNKIKAVLYDMGDIFFESNFWRKWMFEEFGKLSLFDGNFTEFYELYENFLKPVYQGNELYDQAYDKFLSYLKVKNRDEFKDKSFKVKKHFEDTRILFPHVKKTLSEITKRKIFNIVITDNEASEIQLRESILKRFDINEFINKVYSSNTLGLTKPSFQFFQLVLDKNSLAKDEVLFVAHDLEEINGAVDFGIEVIEYNNYLKYDTKANYKINDFNEILNIISGKYNG